jgi:hypothetical protein
MVVSCISILLLLPSRYLYTGTYTSVEGTSTTGKNHKNSANNHTVDFDTSANHNYMAVEDWEGAACFIIAPEDLVYPGRL